jgi:hypothetical protein
VRSWRAVIRRTVAWKTARCTKGDSDALIVGIGDGKGYIR